MGAEARCIATVNGKRVRARARLETDALELRGEGVKLSWPFKQIKKVVVAAGTSSLVVPAGDVDLQLGSAAQKWADKILHPPSRLQKIGVKADWRVAALSVDDQGFLEELERATAFLSVGRTIRHCDAIFFGVTRAAQLKRLERLKASLKPDGALWVVRPKGRPEISEPAVMAAGKAAGLVDVKVISFFSTHTAETFVIPLRSR